MATVEVQPSPHAHLSANTMSGRVPLKDVPNAANSPLRSAAAAAAAAVAAAAFVGSKRSRSHGLDHREVGYLQAPASKRLIVEPDDGSPRKRSFSQRVEPSIITSTTTSTAQIRRPEPVRDVRATKVERQSTKPSTTTTTNTNTTTTAATNTTTTTTSLESIRQWQQHYRKVFPHITFYFEGIPSDVRAKVSRQVMQLGAREEAFFSKSVTHVVTTRPIPPESIGSSMTAGGKLSPKSQEQYVQGRTINPSLLENQNRSKFTFEAPLSKRLPTTNDILYKAREMGMKIWALEKLQRMLQTLTSVDSVEQPPTYPSRTAAGKPKIGREAELSQMLQNEKRQAAVDREWMSELIPFRGCYVYVHDMNEKTRPVMVRDFLIPETRDQGKWPQLRVTSAGRCPFLEDPPTRTRTVTEPARKAVQQTAPRTRAASANNQHHANRPTAAAPSQALVENSNVANRPRSPSKPLDPPKTAPHKHASTDALPAMFGSAQASSLRALPRFAGAEPVASGMQPSNVTSAIRSQMISSTAAAPGGKAGTSRELNALKRKVFERNGSTGQGDSGYMNDVRAAINNDSSRSSKRKALRDIAEENDDEKKASAQRKRRVVEKGDKPGYCENCKDKFDDFNEHIVSREHRKFAIVSENFKDLDALLAKLERI